MKLDKNPKSMVLIMMAVGLFGIGVILTIAFFSNTTLLGVGVTLAVLGGAGAILGCIHMNSLGDSEAEPPGSNGTTVAPPRIPLPHELRFQESFENANRGGLYYEPCTSSPPRDGSFSASSAAGGAFPNGLNDSAQRHFSVGPGSVGVIFNHRHGVGMPLSPFEQRSFPVPQMPNSPPFLSDPDYSRPSEAGQPMMRRNVGLSERTPSRQAQETTGGPRTFWSPQ
jgi:hypothetical protein